MPTCWRLVRVLLVLLLVVPFRGAGAQAPTHARLDRSVDTYKVNRDLTYVELSERDTTLLTQRGLRAGDRAARSFYPDKQTLEVVEAWVDQPDGARLMVPPGSIFTRPSAATQNAPGFVGSLTTTVLFPQLHEGSRTHIVWRRTQTAPPLLGFNAMNQALLEWETVLDETIIEAPADLALHWRARGGFAVEESVAGDTRRIVARIRDLRAQELERNTVHAGDFQPMFLATSLPRLEELGAIYHRQAAARTVPTARIEALAAQIAGDRTGLDAARAIYHWITTNIRYVAVYLDPDDGWVPHSPDAVLGNGYGDCKDHVALMQALLAARGIRAEAGIIDWGTRTADLPLWLPGQFNHVIIHLPEYGHFANPTDHYAPFDALERRLSGKTVVLAGPEGRVVRTPASRPELNRYQLASRFEIDPAGTISGQATLRLSPNLESGMRGAVATASSLADLAERVLSATAEGGFGSFAAGDPRDLATPLALSATWRSPSGVTFQGEEAFLRVPSGVDIEPPGRFRGRLTPTGTRRTPMLSEVGEHIWDATIVLPAGTYAAILPPDVDVQAESGHYTARYRRAGRDISVRRHLVVSREVVTPDAYADLERLLHAPISDARATIVLRRGNGDE